mmetsp:Transcript_1464/g.4767  ORF Transcript_1464/g.4767 Transcript_1464/m.4767 type:complete len:464 (+) Transcript_1464:70-1461(+)
MASGEDEKGVAARYLLVDLPLETEEEDLQTYFSCFGEIEEVTLKRHPETREIRASVKFAFPTLELRAQMLHQPHEIRGSPVTVQTWKMQKLARPGYKGQAGKGCGKYSSDGYGSYGGYGGGYDDPEDYDASGYGRPYGPPWETLQSGYGKAFGKAYSKSGAGPYGSGPSSCYGKACGKACGMGCDSYGGSSAFSDRAFGAGYGKPSGYGGACGSGWGGGWGSGWDGYDSCGKACGKSYGKACYGQSNSYTAGCGGGDDDWDGLGPGMGYGSARQGPYGCGSSQSFGASMGWSASQGYGKAFSKGSFYDKEKDITARFLLTGLPVSTEEEDLRNYFGTFAEIEEVTLRSQGDQGEMSGSVKFRHPTMELRRLMLQETHEIRETPICVQTWKMRKLARPCPKGGKGASPEDTPEAEAFCLKGELAEDPPAKATTGSDFGGGAGGPGRGVHVPPRIPRPHPYAARW